MSVSINSRREADPESRRLIDSSPREEEAGGTKNTASTNSADGVPIILPDGRVNPALMRVDTRRKASYHPGQLVTSAQMSNAHLECLYLASRLMCCNAGVAAEGTFVDVFTNGVRFGHPSWLCCCCESTFTSIAIHAHFDDPLTFGGARASKGDMCNPAPYCCVDWCGLFGGALALQGGVCTGCGYAGHCNEHNLCTYCGLARLCLPVTVMYGLSDDDIRGGGGDEVQRVAHLINLHRELYMQGAGNPPLTISVKDAPPTAAATGSSVVALPFYPINDSLAAVMYAGDGGSFHGARVHYQYDRVTGRPLVAHGIPMPPPAPPAAMGAYHHHQQPVDGIVAGDVLRK